MNHETPQKQARLNSYRRHRATRSHKGPMSWLHSPGNNQFLKQTEWALEEVASRNGTDMLEVTRLRIAEVGDRKLYIWPVTQDDPQGIELKRIGKSLWANFGPFLEEGNLILPINTKERFHLVLVPEEQTPPGIPTALCLDLNNPLERKPINRKKKKKESTPAQQSAATDQA